MDANIRVRVPDALAVALEKEAKRDSRTVSAVIRLAIHDYLKKQGRRRK